MKNYYPLLILFSAFIAIGGSSKSEVEKENSLEAFDKVLSVIKHQRCMNCHPSDDKPRQGDDRHVHLLNVQRGSDGNGLPVMRCNHCHQNENNEYTGVPGAPNWHLAPKSMGWQGLSDAQIGKALLDKTKNGNRSLEDLYKHMAEDALVKWAWTPGNNRTLPPISHEEFASSLRTWIDTGAQIPNE